MFYDIITMYKNISKAFSTSIVYPITSVNLNNIATNKIILTVIFQGSSQWYLPVEIVKRSLNSLKSGFWNPNTEIQ